MSVTEGIGLAGLNRLPLDDARDALLRCCACSQWAASLAQARPYGSLDELLAEADRVLAELDEAELDQALAGHPRIGERVDGAHGAWSRREQAGAASADERTRADLADGNRAYEERFGHVYLVCATGRRAEEMLAVLHKRLRNDPDTERREVRRELVKINAIRLRRLIEGGLT